MKRISLMILMSISVFTLYACGNNSVFDIVIDETYTEYVTMGTSADYPPYEFPVNIDGKTTLVGIDIEIAKVIAKKLGKNLRIVNKGFDFLLEDLVSNKIDFIMAGMTPTEERAKKVDFSKIYYEATQVVMIKKDSEHLYTSIESLNIETIRVGAQLGTIQQDLLEENFAKSQHQIIQNMQNLVLNLKNGQIKGVIVEKPVADGYVAKNSDLAIASFNIGDPDGGSAVAVGKGNKALLDTINEVISELIETGQIDTIVSDAVNLNK